MGLTDTMDAKGGIREVTIEAVVTRKDGTREELGVISSYHKNPLVRLARKLKGQGSVTTQEEK